MTVGLYRLLVVKSFTFTYIIDIESGCEKYQAEGMWVIYFDFIIYK